MKNELISCYQSPYNIWQFINNKDHTLYHPLNLNICNVSSYTNNSILINVGVTKSVIALSSILYKYFREKVKWFCLQLNFYMVYMFDFILVFSRPLRTYYILTNGTHER